MSLIRKELAQFVLASDPSIRLEEFSCISSATTRDLYFLTGAKFDNIHKNVLPATILLQDKQHKTDIEKEHLKQ